MNEDTVFIHDERDNCGGNESLLDAGKPRETEIQEELTGVQGTE